MPTFAGCHFNAYTSIPPCKCTPTRKLCWYYAQSHSGPSNAQLQGIIRRCTVSSNRLSFLNHIVISFQNLQSIVLSHLRPRIGIPRGNIIARILLQRVGLCMRALRIELLAKLAFALRRLGSFLVVKEHGQLSVLMFEV